MLCVAVDTFLKEADFEIRSINWLNLNDRESVWCEVIEKAVYHKSYGLERIKKQSVNMAMIRNHSLKLSDVCILKHDILMPDY